VFVVPKVSYISTSVRQEIENGCKYACPEFKRAREGSIWCPLLELKTTTKIKEDHERFTKCVN
jgi:hypothetical protein